MFVIGMGALLIAMRNHLWAGLAIVGFLALTMSPNRLDVVDVWGVLFLACTSTGLVMWLRRWPRLRWIASSIPFWAMSGASEWLEYVALGLVLFGLVIMGVSVTLPGRRRSGGGDPLPHLASGPLTPITAKVYPGAQPSRILRWATYAFAGLTLVLGVLTGSGVDPATTGALALSSAIIAGTFAFSNWFSGRLRLRIDAKGLHSRVFFREHSIAWKEIASMSLRYVFLPGMGVRVVYYCVRSPTTEFAFPSSMKGAPELQAAIEAATGMAWPVPEVTPTF